MLVTGETVSFYVCRLVVNDVRCFGLFKTTGPVSAYTFPVLKEAIGSIGVLEYNKTFSKIGLCIA